MPDKNRFPAVLEPTPINTMAATRPEGSDPNTAQSIRSIASDVDHVGAVVIPQPIAFDAYNQSVSDTAQSVCSARTDINHIGGVVQNLVVRRLTPRECERLQGFSDDWSRIPWKGKPEEECPDGPRYKACGNSMAVPVMRWIGSRIAAWEALQK